MRRFLKYVLFWLVAFTSLAVALGGIGAAAWIFIVYGFWEAALAWVACAAACFPLLFAVEAAARFAENDRGSPC